MRCYTACACALLGLQVVTALPLDINLDINIDDVDIGIDIGLLDAHIGVGEKDATYDYVVVGGGTAGLAMAARLSEKFTVAVIEAGTYYETVNNQSSVPEYVVDFLSTTLDSSTWAPTDWGFTTTNQTAVGGSSYHYSRAKTLGGW